jgi:hypothetical protein
MRNITTLAHAVFVSATLSMVTVGCSHEPEVSKSIGELIREQNKTSFHLTDVTGFTWDQAYFFPPYATRADVCATLRIEKQDCERRIPVESLDDGLMSIAFLANGRLVHYAMHKTYNGDFTSVTGQQPVSAKAARFRVVEGGGTHYGGAPVLRLELM